MAAGPAATIAARGSCSALQQFGPIVNVDKAAPPYGNTRRLITDADVKNDPNRAHGSVVPGGSAVKDASGKFIHEDVWRYLFTEPVEKVGQPVPADPACLKDLRKPSPAPKTISAPRALRRFQELPAIGNRPRPSSSFSSSKNPRNRDSDRSSARPLHPSSLNLHPFLSRAPPPCPRVPSSSLPWLSPMAPADNIPDHVRPVPPPGIKISPEDRADLEKGVGDLSKEIESLRAFLKNRPAQLALLPDVEIYDKAVDWALRFDEFFKPQEIAFARDLLRRGMERAQSLRQGKTPWLTQTGLVVRGYRSKIDGSVQPFGLVIPASYTAGAAQPVRLDFWCHGRGETLSELAFMDQRQKSPGQFTPPDAIVVHLYGRYCCANKFAGEVDLFEALDQVKRTYPVDENRLVVRGFSMGGAATWHFAVHYPGTWCAAAPGAGFSETADFLRTFQDEKLAPTWFERKLWHLYDSADYALNLSNCPTVGLQRRDRPPKAGPPIRWPPRSRPKAWNSPISSAQRTAHAYHPDAPKEIDRRIDAIVHLGRNPAPERIHFTSCDACATINASGSRSTALKNIGTAPAWMPLSTAPPKRSTPPPATSSALSFSFGPGLCPFDATKTVGVVLDEQPLVVPPPQTEPLLDRPFHQDLPASGPSPQPPTTRRGRSPSAPVFKAPSMTRSSIASSWSAPPAPR